MTRQRHPALTTTRGKLDMADAQYALDSTALPTISVPTVFCFEDREIVVEVERLNLKLIEEDALVKACGDRTENRKASIERIGTKSLSQQLDHALYVIENASKTASKIGVTHNPIKRMEGLQCGSHEQLSYRYLFWLPKRAAFGLEGFALRVCVKLGKRLAGEWINFKSEDAAALIAVLAGESGLPLANSGLFLRNHAKLEKALGLGAGEPSLGYNNDPFWVLTKAS
jgi:hypothetical protein